LEKSLKQPRRFLVYREAFSEAFRCLNRIGSSLRASSRTARFFPLEAAATAIRLRGLLRDVGLAAFPKTSGGHGIHVFVPLGVPHRSRCGP
jgi:hypothetical protein